MPNIQPPRIAPRIPKIMSATTPSLDPSSLDPREALPCAHDQPPNYPAHKFSYATVAVALVEQSGTVVKDDDC